MVVLKLATTHSVVAGDLKWPRVRFNFSFACFAMGNLMVGTCELVWVRTIRNFVVRIWGTQELCSC